MAMARATKIEDVYIAVMGYSGTGKSSFIATSSGMDVKVGHSLISCKFFFWPVTPMIELN